MARSTAQNRKIIQSPALLKALKGFVPVFADRGDLAIVNRLESLNKKLRAVDNEVLRGITKSTAPRAITSKMREILSMEESLIREITSRNMDF